MGTIKKIRIGTRGSPLALRQTEMVRAELARAWPDLETEVVVIQTSGDWCPEDGEVRLSEAEGGKGQFAKEIEEKLLSGEIEAAVHSMKDMESRLPEGLVIAHMLPREDPRDVILFNDLAKNSQNIKDWPTGFTVGTSSVRRAAFLKALRPDLNIVPLRGNVQTRIDKLKSGQADATVLAYAGLKRLGLQEEVGLILEPEEMLPSAGQGAVGIEILSSNDNVLSIFSQISCAQTVSCVRAERAALALLDGSCHTPIGAYAVRQGDGLYLQVKVAAADGSQIWSEEGRGDDPEALGEALGIKLKSRIPPGVLS